MASVMLLLGSNLGNMRDNLVTACHLLEQNGMRINSRSKIYRTKPLGFASQPDFLNQGLCINTELEPRQLLKAIKKIESSMGRDKSTRRWGPRLIDIDIIFYDRIRINEPDLQVPHRQFFKRPFAQIIAAELNPDFKPPGKKKRCVNLSME